jgi:hypothetical protein
MIHACGHDGWWKENEGDVAGTGASDRESCLLYLPAGDNMRRDDAITESGIYGVRLEVTYISSASPRQADICLGARRSQLQNDRLAGFVPAPMLIWQFKQKSLVRGLHFAHYTCLTTDLLGM